jgi:hypothetical protein
MPGILDLIAHAGLLALVAGGVIALRRAQPDPNPAIEAREAAALAAGLVVVPRVERRINPLPYLGRERRDEGARDAAAWRRSA